jgi:Zn-dependent protease with chaperone function
MRFNTTAYRYPRERIILLATVITVLLVIALTATATVCLSVVFIIGAIVFSYQFSQAHHRQLMQNALQITHDNAPGLVELALTCKARLQVESVNVFIVRGSILNAYTFGLTSPKSIVLYENLIRLMDQQELQFIIGHEMGHVKLGHTWLNSLVGGMAGIPASLSASAILVIALRSWNRACEYSADRAGMLACGNAQKAISSLIKLETGSGSYSETAIQRIENQDDDWLNNLSKLLATHPMIVRRIHQLQAYSKTREYQQLQLMMNKNLS